MSKLWSLLLAFLLSGLPISFDLNTSRPQYLVREGIHEPDEGVPRSYDVWIVETSRAVYRVEKYDQVWDWNVARSEAVEIALLLEYTLETIEKYCGDARGEKTRVEVLSMAKDDPLLDKPYVTRDAAVITFQHIRSVEYVEALARAFLKDQPAWVAFGVAGVVNGDLLGEEFLADYFLSENTELLRLTGVRFSEEICGEYEVAVAKGAATSLIRYIKKQCYYNTLLDVIQSGDIGAIKQAWLDSIGVNLAYHSEDEALWQNARLFRSAWVPMLIEMGDSLFEFHVVKDYWALQYDQSYQMKTQSAAEFERMIAVSAMTQWDVRNALSNIAEIDQDMGTIRYVIDPFFVSGEPAGAVNASIYPYVLDAFAYLPQTVEPCADHLEQGALSYAIANGLAHVYLGTSPQWREEGQWLFRGVATYVAMTLPRTEGPAQNLDSAYQALSEAATGAYPAIAGVDREKVAGYYDLIVDCYLEMGGNLSEAWAFDPVLYTNAAAYATMLEMESTRAWDSFGILSGRAGASDPPDELITSFVCYLVDEASLPELIAALKSGEWEATYERTYDDLFAEWKDSLQYIMAAKNDWMGVK